MAKIALSSLLDMLLQRKKTIVALSRFGGNPIINPRGDGWESKATFNPGAIFLENKFHILYRAQGQDNTSSFGYAVSSDGENIETRLGEPVYVPREEFESKSSPGCLSGCEDPRLTPIGDKIYMCYTAFNGANSPRVALTSIAKNDFLKQRWEWKKPVLISPPDFDDKDAFVFPEKVNGEYLVIHRGGVDIDYSRSKNLEYSGEEWLEENRWISPRRGWWDGQKVGAAAPPVKTQDGWVLLYHGVSESFTYRVGAILLDLDNPLRVLARTDNPIFEPEESYETKGIVSNVVFPCGNVLKDDTLFVYYGGGDRVVGVAKVDINDLLKVLKLCRV